MRLAGVRPGGVGSAGESGSRGETDRPGRSGPQGTSAFPASLRPGPTRGRAPLRVSPLLAVLLWLLPIAALATGPTSPRLARLLEGWQRLATVDAPAAQALVQRFVDDLRTGDGAPLVEAVVDPNERRQLADYYQAEPAARVSFIWDNREAKAATVLVHSGISSLRGVDAELKPLGATGLLYLSVVLPQDSRVIYSLATGPAIDLASSEPSTIDAWIERNGRADPLNRLQWPDRRDPAIEARVQALPDQATIRPDSVVDVRRALVPAAADGGTIAIPGGPLPPGAWSQHRLRSEILGNERTIRIYRQRFAEPGHGAPDKGNARWRLLIAYDGDDWYSQYVVAEAIDTLASADRIAPTLAVLVGVVHRDRELPPNEAFVRFVSDELLPWLQAREPGLSRRPEDIVVSGFSLGGLAAAWLGYRRPDLVGNVLSSSGSFWWTPKGSQMPGQGPGDDWLTRQFVTAPRLPLKIHLSAGRLETGEHGAAGILDNQRRLRDVLQARGYAVDAEEGPGGHDAEGWAQALIHGLPRLLPPDQLTHQPAHQPAHEPAHQPAAR